MPRIQLVGEEAVQRTASHFGIKIQSEESLFGVSFVGDLISKMRGS